MVKRHSLWPAAVILWSLAFVLPLVAAVDQVRVVRDRATIYVEPNRSSAGLETVEKGTLLTLFQNRKVREAWYYVSFQSKRFGGRISGFVHEADVELVIEEKKPPLKKEETPPPPPPEVELEKPKPIVPIEKIVKTLLPPERGIRPPRREPPWKDLAWRTLPPAPEEREVKTKETVPTLPTKKEEVKTKPPAVIPEKTQPVPPAQAPAQLPKVKPRPQERSRLTVGLGFGPSLGGAGGLVQLNTRLGFSLHAGLGVYPTTLVYSETDWVKNEVLYSVGVKVYLPFKTSSIFPYLDVQYGGLRVEAAQMVLGIYEYTYILGHEQKTLQGISTLAGAELRRGRFGLNVALGLGYALTDWKYLTERLSLAFDFSLLTYF